MWRSGKVKLVKLPNSVKMFHNTQKITNVPKVQPAKRRMERFANDTNVTLLTQSADDAALRELTADELCKLLQATRCYRLD